MIQYLKAKGALPIVIEERKKKIIRGDYGNEPRKEFDECCMFSHGQYHCNIILLTLDNCSGRHSIICLVSNRMKKKDGG